jgi:hypothetical protein
MATKEESSKAKEEKDKKINAADGMTLFFKFLE